MNNVVADTYHVEQQSFTLSINMASDSSTPPPLTHTRPSQSWAGAGAVGVGAVSGSLGYVVSIDVQFRRWNACLNRGYLDRKERRSD
jgi:hypothetical protein